MGGLPRVRGASSLERLEVGKRVHPVHRRPAGLVLDLGDPRGRGVHGPEALVTEAERVEDDEPDHDRVAHEHDRLPVVRLQELAHAGRHARTDLAEGLPAPDAQEVRGRAPALVVVGEARGDLPAGQPPPRTERHLAKRRLRHHGDPKSTRPNSSHSQISYAVLCLKKKKVPRDWRSSIFPTGCPAALAQRIAAGATFFCWRKTPDTYSA